MSQSGSDRTRLGRRLRQWARIVSSAAALALALSVAPMLMQQSGVRVPGITLRSALACGLGATPTMLANNDPALLYPVPPNVNIPADEPIGIFALNYASGTTISFAEDFSNMNGAPAPNTLSWRWDFGDGSAASEQATPSATIKWPSHTYAKPGKYAVRSQIWDPGSNAWTDFDSAWINVIPSAIASPPVALATASATAVVQGGKITFDATGSHAVVGSHVTYEWNFNDASTATGSHVTHEFDINGKGFVALIVTDDRGAKSVARINIAVVTDPTQLPTANLVSPTDTLTAGQPITFDASGSRPDSSGDQLDHYNWDFGDGSQATTQSATTTHTYARAGTYRIAVQAVDIKGTPAQAVLTVQVAAAGASGGQSGGASSAVARWLPYGIGAIIVLLLAVGIIWLARNQMKQARIEHERAALMELRRAKRIPQGGVRPGDPRWGDPRAGNRTGGRTRASAGQQGRRGGRPR